MMQSCASVCEGSREVGPFYNRGAKDHVPTRVPTTSDRHRQFVVAADECRNCLRLLPLDLAHYGVGRRTTPSGTSPVVRNRHSAMSSLRASATIMVLRF